ncbi:unnamed protein product [Pleuronectes platessa]|uniref:Uncharacterized protein n=1 Tax=Pleuronectes platessa TaxID=8262 RepID=A0A9N7U2M4_PLEPL|nr:unnamed protein product [Pleuronectes platessa]
MSASRCRSGFPLSRRPPRSSPCLHTTALRCHVSTRLLELRLQRQAEWEVVDESAAAGQIHMVVDGGEACGSSEETDRPKLRCHSNVERLFIFSSGCCDACGITLESEGLCWSCRGEWQLQVSRTERIDLMHNVASVRGRRLGLDLLMDHEATAVTQTSPSCGASRRKDGRSVVNSRTCCGVQR